MLCNNSFYQYIHKIVVTNEDELRSSDVQEKMRINLLRCLNFFPHFPDIDLIIDLSRENYERKICFADLVFLPFNDIDSSLFSFMYANDKIHFDNSNRRLIRKISESLDNLHALVLRYDKNDNIYCIRGIIEKPKIKDISNYYLINILGYLKWSSECKNFKLFDYDAGKFYDCHHSVSDLNEQINKVLCSVSVINNDNLTKIIKLIVELKHGTSFVVFDSADNANREATRLCNAGRGFAAKHRLEFDELLKCLPQFTKVDGGLILDKELNCYAYGCIYDGTVDDSFLGSLARGSRFNSTKLYVHDLNCNKQMVCFGVVFSDDGGVECVKE